MQLENKITQFEPEIASILATLCYHIHPDIVSYIQDMNLRNRAYFENLFDQRIELDHYFFRGSANVFPGIRRYVNTRGLKRSYSHDERAILDDNVFPRHLWCFLLKGTAYSGPGWKETGLSEFELAHIYAHKPSETGPEHRFFHELNEELPPFGNFTCAANVVLLPKGTIRPTDNSALTKAVFFKRHIELYGESTLNGRSGFNEDAVPSWYSSLLWNNPILPPDWRDKLERLMLYRKNKITSIMGKHGHSNAA